MSTAQKLREIADLIEKGDLSDADKTVMAEVSTSLQSLASTQVEDQTPRKTILRSEWEKMNSKQSTDFFSSGGRVVDN